MYQILALTSGRVRLLVVLGLLAGMAVVLELSNRANNATLPELAGRWTITRMENVSPDLREYTWENLSFTIDSRGLLGNIDTPFTMVISRDNRAPDRFYVSNARAFDSSAPYTLVRDAPDRLYLYPTAASKIVFERLKK